MVWEFYDNFFSRFNAFLANSNSLIVFSVTNLPTIVFSITTITFSKYAVILYKNDFNPWQFNLDLDYFNLFHLKFDQAYKRYSLVTNVCRQTLKNQRRCVKFAQINNIYT